MRIGPWVGRLMAAFIGVVMIGAAELVLRQVPSLQTPPFTIKVASVGQRVLRTINPDYARRFFSGVSVAGMRMTPHPYLVPAPVPTLRVVVAGGSTVQGYPHPRRLTFSAYLQAMLEDALPNHTVEVFNIGITAISSFAVAQAVEDAMVLEPDIVVVYTGHNEIYGVYGSASLSQGGASILAKELHYGLMQWSLSALVRRALHAMDAADKARPASLLRVMSAAGAVAVDDPRRVQAAENLRKNLQQIAETCRENGAELVLCTLASNERGFAASIAEPLLSPEELTQWRLLFEQGRRLLAEGRAHVALEHFDRAAALDRDHAAVQFYRARCLELLGSDREASSLYARARDLDPRPWRAHSQLNEVIRKQAKEQQVPLVDIDKLFRSHSPAAGIGWELMADHLHPSAAGQILLARGIVEELAVVEDALLLERVRSAARYDSIQGDTPLERLAVLHDMQAFLSEEPMSSGNEAQAQWLASRADSLWAQLRPGERSGYQRWRQGKGLPLLALNAADQLFAARDIAHAAAYYRAAQREEPYTRWGDLWATLRWGRCRELLAGSFDIGEKAEVAAMVERMKFVAQTPDFSPGLLAFFSGYAEHLLGVDGTAQLEIAVGDEGVRRLFFYDLLALLCEGLLKEQRYADAERYVREVTAELGQREYGRFLLAQIAAQKGR